MEIIFYVIVIIAMVIVMARSTYLDWKENFQNEYRDMMAGYERKKRDGK